MKTLILATVLFLPAALSAAGQDGWISMFNGKTLSGWKANQNPESWTVRDGAITGDGEASHLFWMVQECADCEFKAEVKIGHGGNSGMYFRTAMGPGFPKGYEAQVNTSHTDPVKTGSLYGFHKIFDQLIPDDVWARSTSSLRAITSLSRSTTRWSPITPTRRTPTPRATSPCNSTTRAAWCNTAI